MGKNALILYNIRSIHNVGSIFRSADGAGFGKIYLCGITPSPVDRFGKVLPALAKVSLGAENFVAWDDSHRSPQKTTKLIEKLKCEDYIICALEQHVRSVPYDRAFSGKSAKKKYCLILGEEVKGLPSFILSRADKILEIPMHGKKESLNVSVAAGIAMYALSEK